VILEREQNANAGHPPPSHFKKCYQRQAHDDDVESGGNNKQSVCVSDTDVSDYDFSKAGMKDTGVRELFNAFIHAHRLQTNNG